MKLLSKKMEGFKPNLKDKTVEKMRDLFIELFDARGEINKRANGHVTNKQYKEHCKDTIQQIESLTRARFGVNITLKITNAPLAVWCSGPVNGGSGMQDHNKILKECNDYIKRGGGKDLADVKKFVKEVEMIDRHLNLSAVKVDMDKLRIEGLPIEYKPTIYLNLAYYTRSNLYLLPEELFAGFLHELGHVFTYVCYAYRLSVKKLTLENACKRHYMKNKKENPFYMAYREVFAKDKSKYKDSEAKELDACRDIINDAMEGLYFTDKKDSEMIADAFVAALGYGAEVVSLLEKLGYAQSHHLIISDLQTEILTLTMVFGLAITAYVCFFAFTTAVHITALISTIFLMTGMCFVVAGIVMLSFTCAFIGENTLGKYGSAINRIKRQRRNCVMMLSQLVDAKDTDPEVLMLLDNQIKTIDDQLDYVDSYKNTSLLESMGDWIMGLSNQFTKTRLFTESKEILEDLIHNDLTVAKYRLQEVFKNS